MGWRPATYLGPPRIADRPVTSDTAALYPGAVSRPAHGRCQPVLSCCVPADPRERQMQSATPRLACLLPAIECCEGSELAAEAGGELFGRAAPLPIAIRA